MDVGLYKKPWEHHSYSYKGKDQNGFEFPAEFHTVKDSEKLSFRKCDLVRYRKKYRYEEFGDWRDWFPEKPKKKRVVIYKNIPKDLTGQYGIVIQRYRKVKNKGWVFRDYGVTILALTGRRKGILKDCDNLSYPFTCIARFPFGPPLPKILEKSLTKILKGDPIALCNNIKDDEEQRDLVLEKIWNYFTGEIE